MHVNCWDVDLATYAMLDLLPIIHGFRGCRDHNSWYHLCIYILSQYQRSTTEVMIKLFLNHQFLYKFSTFISHVFIVSGMWVLIDASNFIHSELGFVLFWNVNFNWYIKFDIYNHSELDFILFFYQLKQCLYYLTHGYNELYM